MFPKYLKIQFEPSTIHANRWRLGLLDEKFKDRQDKFDIMGDDDVRWVDVDE